MKATTMTSEQKRAGRTAFGTVLILGAVALVLNLLVSIPLPHVGIVHGWVIVVATWAIAIGSYFGAAHWSGGLSDDDDGDGRRMRSLTRPAMGLAFMLPLTLHMPFAIALGGPEGFDIWCGLSIVLAGLAHLLFASMLVQRVEAIATGTKPRSLLSLYLWVVAAGLLPGVVPAIFVAVTGLPLLATLIPALDAIAASEAVAEAELPRAIVHVAGNIRSTRRAA